MRHSLEWDTEYSMSLKCLTNWTRNSKDKQMVFWKEVGKSMTLETTLHASTEFKNLMTLNT